MKYCFGVDVGGTSIKLGLFSVDGVILDKWEIPTRKENQGEYILPDIAEEVLKKMKEKRLDRSELKGVGIGIPAPVKSNGEVYKTANLGWGYKNVKKELGALLDDIRIEAANDANLAAMGEMWLGAGRGEKDIVMVTLGTGVGGGIIVDERMLVGSSGACGEIGHICVNPEETGTCGCGLHGCLEYYSSATGIARLANNRLAKNDDASILRGQKVNAKTVFDAVKMGDKVAIEIAEEFGLHLGRGLAAVTALANPALIIVGGGVSKAGDILFRFIEKEYHAHAFFADHEVRFALAELGNDAGICGAARMVLS